MIEITTFGLMVLALIVVTLARDYRKAKRDQVRAMQMNQLVTEFTGQKIELLVSAVGDPYETATGLSGRALCIWKAPPNDKLPRGSGLLTLIATVDADGVLSQIEWRDHIEP
jgi:hypothetical protein